MKSRIVTAMLVMLFTLSAALCFSGDQASIAAAKFANNVASRMGVALVSGVEHWYHVEAYRDGVKMWEDYYPNLVTTQGKNRYLDCTLKTGSCTPITSYVGLVIGPNETDFAAGDTHASHTGWTESTSYDETTRPTWTPGTISGGSVDNSASKATFTISASVVISGTFLATGHADAATKGSTSSNAFLMGAGAFSGGDRSLVDNDVLYVTITTSIS